MNFDIFSLKNMGSVRFTKPAEIRIIIFYNVIMQSRLLLYFSPKHERNR